MGERFTRFHKFNQTADAELSHAIYRPALPSRSLTIVVKLIRDAFRPQCMTAIPISPKMPDLWPCVSLAEAKAHASIEKRNITQLHAARHLRRNASHSSVGRCTL